MKKENRKLGIIIIIVVFEKNGLSFVFGEVEKVIFITGERR